MSFYNRCPKGHQYTEADYYHNWPFGLPKCSVCREEVPPTRSPSGDWYYDVQFLEVGGIAVGTAYARLLIEDEEADVEYRLLHCHG